MPPQIAVPVVLATALLAAVAAFAPVPSGASPAAPPVGHHDPLRR